MQKKILLTLLLPILSGCMYQRSYVNSTPQMKINNCIRRSRIIGQLTRVQGRVGLVAQRIKPNSDANCYSLISQQEVMAARSTMHANESAGTLSGKTVHRYNSTAYAVNSSADSVDTDSSESVSTDNAQEDNGVTNSVESNNSPGTRKYTKASGYSSDVDIQTKSNGVTVISNPTRKSMNLTVSKTSADNHSIKTGSGKEYTSSTNPSGKTTYYNKDHQIVGTSQKNNSGSMDFYNKNGQKVSSLE